MIYMSVVLSSRWLLPSSTTGMASTRRHGAPAAMAARSIGTIGRARPACSVGRDGMGMGWLGHAAARQALLDQSKPIACVSYTGRLSVLRICMCSPLRRASDESLVRARCVLSGER